METALEMAEKAFERGEFPVGCIIVRDGEIIARGNRSGTATDTNRFSEIDHAEIRALKNMETAGLGIPQGERDNTVLYCTMEPCLMCFSAIILSGIQRVVYAYEDAMGGGTGCDLSSLPPLYRESQIQVVGGVCRQKSLDLFYNFFNKEENLYWKDSFLERYTRCQKQDSV
ncbi:MAG: nucleoside deaminase [Desulfobacterales bacterium]|nr:nucleoside deaminase [Desulfobacterales bacterium]